MKALNSLENIYGGINYSLEFLICPDMQDDDIAAIAHKSGLSKKLITDALAQSIEKNKNMVISIDMFYSISDMSDSLSENDFYDYCYY